ncbi:MAG: NAD(P)/FAD-dependent oxidoreductase [Alphaproteobacteria bacterium]
MSSSAAAEVQHTDVVVIGAGPVGLFAVFECGMLGLRCRVIDALDAVGGQLTALYPEKPIYDIPGYPRIEAGELVRQLERQAAPFHPTYHLNQRVERLQRLGDGRWRIETERGIAIDAWCVIIAGGAGAFGPNRPPLPNIAAYEGTSVLYSIARRDGLAGKRVVIAGGGDSAVDWALSLADIARVAVVHRRDKFRAAPDSERKLRALAGSGKVELVVPFQLAGLEGPAPQLSGVVVESLDGERRVLPADMLLAFYGLATSLGPIAAWGLNLNRQQIDVDPTTAATNLPGVFAVGDMAHYTGKLKLILTGFAEAAQAAHAAYAIARPGKALHFEYSTTKGVPQD